MPKAKRYNEDILNGLAGSAFFPKPPAPGDSDPTQQLETSRLDPPSPPEPTIPRMSERPNVRTNERPAKRQKIRHTFDIYSDQLRSLKQIALEREADTGDRVLLGELVQEALDMLITAEPTRGK